MDCEGVYSTVVAFRNSLDTTRSCTLPRPFSEYPSGDSNLLPPSTASPLYALAHALSDAAWSGTSSSSHPQDTQRDDRNQGDVSGCEFEGELSISRAHERLLRSTAQVKRQRSNTKIQHAGHTSPARDLSYSSSLHGIQYDVSQPEIAR